MKIHHKKEWAKVMVRAWTDPTFKKHLLSHPKQALAEMGIELHTDKEIRIVENTDEITYLPLPQKPSDSLSMTELKKVAAAGDTACCCGTTA